MRILGISPNYGQYCRPQNFKPIKSMAIDSFVSFKGNEDNDEKKIVQGEDYLYTDQKEYEKAKAKWQKELKRIKKEAPPITRWVQVLLFKQQMPKLVSDAEYREYFVRKAEIEELERIREQEAIERQEHRDYIEDQIQDP